MWQPMRATASRISVALGSNMWNGGQPAARTELDVPVVVEAEQVVAPPVRVGDEAVDRHGQVGDHLSHGHLQCVVFGHSGTGSRQVFIASSEAALHVDGQQVPRHKVGSWTFEVTEG